MDLTGVAIEWLRAYGPLALFVFAFLESSMLFPFLPSEVVVPAAAGLLVTGPASFLVFVAAAATGGTLGALVPFYLCYRPSLRESRLRDRLPVSEDAIARGQAWFRRWGRQAVLWGRFLPGVRSVVSIPAGLANMRPALFVGYTAAGTVGFYAAIGAAVYYGRQQSLFAALYSFALDRPLLAALGLVLAAGVALLAHRYRRRFDP